MDYPHLKFVNCLFPVSQLGVFFGNPHLGSENCTFWVRLPVITKNDNAEKDDFIFLSVDKLPKKFTYSSVDKPT